MLKYCLTHLAQSHKLSHLAFTATRPQGSALLPTSPPLFTHCWELYHVRELLTEVIRAHIIHLACYCIANVGFQAQSFSPASCLRPGPWDKPTLSTFSFHQICQRWISGPLGGSHPPLQVHLSEWVPRSRFYRVGKGEICGGPHDSPKSQSYSLSCLRQRALLW